MLPREMRLVCLDDFRCFLAIFGGSYRNPIRMGDAIISSARSQDEIMNKHYLLHELGHMFRAPSKERESIGGARLDLGVDCMNNLCVMKQKIDLFEAREYAHRIKNSKVFPFCKECINDIKEYQIK